MSCQLQTSKEVAGVSLSLYLSPFSLAPEIGIPQRFPDALQTLVANPESNTDTYKQQMKYTNNECIKNFRDPKTPTLLKFFMHGFFLYFEGHKGPMHKEFRGVRGSLEGGVCVGGFC